MNIYTTMIPAMYLVVCVVARMTKKKKKKCMNLIVERRPQTSRVLRIVHLHHLATVQLSCGISSSRTVCYCKIAISHEVPLLLSCAWYEKKKLNPVFGVSTLNGHLTRMIVIIGY